MIQVTFLDGKKRKFEGKDEVRVLRMAHRAGSQFRTLDSGLVINLNHVVLIEPDVLRADEGEGEGSRQIVMKVEEGQAMHVGQLRACIENTGLSDDEFAKSIDYSPVTLKAALTSGKVSVPMSDAVIKKYGK